MLLDELPVHRFSVEDVQRMGEIGILHPEARIELLDGVLIDMPHPTPEHSGALAWLIRRMAAAVGEREVRVQDTLLVEGGFVAPDLMVVDPLPRDRLPTTAALVVEISVTSQRYDAAKALRYARAEVAEYWIVDLPARRVDVHRRPSPDGYGAIVRHDESDTIATDVSADPVDVSALLG